MRSWWRETVRLYVKYAAVGLAALPFAALYVSLKMHGHGGWLILTLSLLGGLVVGLLIWSRLDRLRQPLMVTMPNVEPAVLVYSTNWDGLLEVVISELQIADVPERIERFSERIERFEEPERVITLPLVQLN